MCENRPRGFSDTPQIALCYRNGPFVSSGLFLHCTGQPHIVIEHKTGGWTQDWYDPRRSAVAKCRRLFLVRWEARLS